MNTTEIRAMLTTPWKRKSAGDLFVAASSLRQEPRAAPYNDHHECGDAKDERINLPNCVIFLSRLTFVDA
jgi:hypothetical protein